MKISKLMLFIGLVALIGLVPLVSKSQIGSLEVCVYCINGDPIEGALINVGGLYSGITGADGCVIFEELLVGEWEVQCMIEGNPPDPIIVYIEEGMLTVCNFEIYCPQFVVEPLEVNVILEPNEQTEETILLTNPGLEDVEWTAELEILTPGSMDWISIDPISGILAPGETTEMIVYFDASNVFNSFNNAIINYSTSPNVGSPNVAIEMLIEGFPFIDGFNYEVNCTNVQLNWLVYPPGLDADSIHVFRDSVLIATIFENYYLDSLLFPDSTYTYFLTGFFINGNYNISSLLLNTFVPLPNNLEPLNLEGLTEIPNELDVTLMWYEPDVCLNPIGYNIYRNGELINDDLVAELIYVDPEVLEYLSYIEYNVTAVYYFGESEPSITLTFTCCTGINDEGSSLLSVYPNPATEKLFIQSPFNINQIELLNNLGLPILNNIVNNSSYQIDVSDLSPGVYFLKIEINQDFILQKVLIQ